MILKPIMLGHFGLTHDPFGGLQKAEDVFPSLELKTARSLVNYAVAHNELVAVVGGYGTGKTSIRRGTVATLADSVKVIEVDSEKEGLTIHAIEESCLHALGYDNPPRSKVARRRMLKAAWIDLHERKQSVLVVIDEAHRVRGATMKSLKELREQSHFAYHEALFAVLLVGHPQLLSRLAWEARDVLARLEAQNVLHVSRFIPQEAAAYIRHRLNAAGGANIASDEVLELVASRATPLELNTVMLKLLDAACANGERFITAERVRAELPPPPGADGEFNGGEVDALLNKLGGTDAEGTNSGGGQSRKVG